MRTFVALTLILLSVAYIVFISITKDEKPDTGNLDKWQLWIGETRLRGTNIHQRLVYPELDEGLMGIGRVGPPFEQEDFNRLSSLGANWVQISHPGIFGERPPYKLDEEVEENLDRLIEMVTKADMFVTIAFRTGPGRSEFSLYPEQNWFPRDYVNDEVWKEKDAQDAWANMWRYVANRYKDNPYIAGYYILVEPNPADALYNISDPSKFYPKYEGTISDWNQMHLKITKAIREVDKKTPILISSMEYGSLKWLAYLKPNTDKRTVYVVNQYELEIYTHQETQDNINYPSLINLSDRVESFDKKWLDRLLTEYLDSFVRKYNVYVTIGETGAVRYAPNVAEFSKDQFELFEKRGINYALWEWFSEWGERNYPESYTFSIIFGPEAENKTYVPNELLNLVKGYWSKNKIRPSNFK